MLPTIGSGIGGLIGAAAGAPQIGATIGNIIGHEGSNLLGTIGVS